VNAKVELEVGRERGGVPAKQSDSRGWQRDHAYDGARYIVAPKHMLSSPFSVLSKRVLEDKHLDSQRAGPQNKCYCHLLLFLPNHSNSDSWILGLRQPPPMTWEQNE
jgi:hypothetical protein